MSSDGWNDQERADLALAAPELAGMTREELQRLAQRYPSDARLRALMEGRPTQGAINEAAQEDAKRDAELRRRYPKSYEAMKGR
jgi:hypothetical protein